MAEKKTLLDLDRLPALEEMQDIFKEKEMIDKLRCRNGNLEITVSRQETSVMEL